MVAHNVQQGKKRVDTHKAFDDDGEAHGGQRLLGVLNKEKVVPFGAARRSLCGPTAARVVRGRHMGHRQCGVVGA